MFVCAAAAAAGLQWSPVPVSPHWRIPATLQDTLRSPTARECPRHTCRMCLSKVVHVTQGTALTTHMSTASQTCVSPALPLYPSPTPYLGCKVLFGLTRRLVWHGNLCGNQLTLFVHFMLAVMCRVGALVV
jgi:hypothetical protein